MELLIHVFIIFILFTFVGSVLTIAKMFYINKHGKAVFKINYNKFKKNKKSKKEFDMNVTPFLDKEENIYLPFKYVAFSLGFKRFRSDSSHKVILKLLDKNIKINFENDITIENKSSNTSIKLRENIRVINDELMLPESYIKDIFDVNINLDETTGEIVLK
ncbi:copper amine oxidase N-terminal domain-containing protein [Clostridium oceanicum]|uniref:Copper amine oxidase N-terminal domain-containing protein n=1 Tax=Clostridium oceanicum TaxID=1543 RepID=A0ABN1JSS6_9CLOT